MTYQSILKASILILGLLTLFEKKNFLLKDDVLQHGDGRQGNSSTSDYSGDQRGNNCVQHDIGFSANNSVFEDSGCPGGNSESNTSGNRSFMNCEVRLFWNNNRAGSLG